MREFEHHEDCMGTVFTFRGLTDLNVEGQSEAILHATNTLHKADAIFSLYKPDSPLSRLAGGETSVAECPAVVEQVWELCEKWGKVTDGWFSAFTQQNTFDPSGLVKTWAAQFAAEKLIEAGITDFTLNAGGDILISEQQSREEFWRIAIGKPVSIASKESGVLTVLDLAGTEYRAVATSGSAERGEHIWNPKGSKLQKDVVQVSVIAQNLVEADVWATAAFAEGIGSLKRINRQPNLEALYVMADGSLQGTDGLIPLFAKPKG
jgi:thiamine biosynthesis lipoprotein